MSAPSSTDNGCTHVDPDLYKAAINGKFEVFEKYAQPLDHLLTGENKNTILHLHLNSTNERSRDFVEKVLVKCPQLLWKTNNDEDIPLHIAAKYEHIEIVKILIEEAKKPIHRDVEAGEEEVVRRMLRSRNKQHETALHLAARGQFRGVVREILEHEDPNYTYSANKCGESPVYLAADTFESDETAIDIIKKFESPDCSGPNGTTVFHLAAHRNFSYANWRDLLSSKIGILVNQADESGWTPFHVAASRGSPAVRIILEKEKRLAYATDKERNRTALHMASCRGIVPVMKAIIDSCPECCEITDVRGWNVLHYAVISREVEAVKIIMKDPSLVYLMKERDIKGYTPLHLLMASPHKSSLLSWLQSKESALPYKFLKNEVISIYGQKFQLEIESKDEEEILEWMNNLGNDPSGNKLVVRKRWKEREKEIEEKVIPGLEKAKESHLVAAALVATVTFAAAFTLPGGYKSDENDSKLKGIPILTRNAAFKAFVITDAIAMVLSTSSVFIHFIMVLLGYKERYYWLIRSAFWFIVLAMGAMVVAFVTGTYAVLAPNSMELAIATCVIGLSFFIHVFYASIRVIYDFIKRVRGEDRSLSLTESVCWLLRSAPQYLLCSSMVLQEL